LGALNFGDGCAIGFIAGLLTATWMVVLIGGLWRSKRTDRKGL
jgi:hypothetical protein